MLFHSPWVAIVSSWREYWIQYISSVVVSVLGIRWVRRPCILPPEIITDPLGCRTTTLVNVSLSSRPGPLKTLFYRLSSTKPNLISSVCSCVHCRRAVMTINLDTLIGILDCKLALANIYRIFVLEINRPNVLLEWVRTAEPIIFRFWCTYPARYRYSLTYTSPVNAVSYLLQVLFSDNWNARNH